MVLMRVHYKDTDAVHAEYFPTKLHAMVELNRHKAIYNVVRHTIEKV